MFLLRSALCLSLLLCMSCVEEGSDSSSPEQSEDAAIETFDAQLNAYGYGVRVVDAYYLEPSSVGTRLVVTIELVNESEPAIVSFRGNGNANRPTPYVVTQGAGNLSSMQFGPGDLFEDEFEQDHDWCLVPVEVSKGGSARCAIFFYQEGKNFESVDRMVVKIDVEGASMPTEVVNRFDEAPRQTP